MVTKNFKKTIEHLLFEADITINGKRPFDIQVHDERLYERVLSMGSVGLGEAYMDGWWDCEQLDELFNKLLRAQLDKKVKSDWRILLQTAKAFLFNMQAGKRAYAIATSHYDLGNDLYRAMLDKRLTYTCAYWKNASTLDEAQEAKLDLVCKKLHVQEGQKILDIGCGWGSFAKFAAEKYKVSVVGITVSRQQAVLATELCQGLPVEIRVQDYRDVHETFDHIVSLGMFEHVGHKNHRAYMKMVARCLGDNGLFLLHTIGSNMTSTTTDRWIDKYIFPNSLIPSLEQIAKSSEGIFVMEDWHNFGIFYDRTLLTWFKNFDAEWNSLKNTYDERFYRMWKYYLLTCAGTFRARKNQLWQIVFSKKGVEGGYNSIR